MTVKGTVRRFLFSDEDAKARGLTPIEESAKAEPEVKTPVKAVTPANKGRRTTANK